MPLYKDDVDIAVALWEAVRDEWIKDAGGKSLKLFKHNFLKKFGYESKWENDCLLCNYYAHDSGVDSCTKCPLIPCLSSSSEYMTVTDQKLPVNERIDACNAIIRHIRELPVDTLKVKTHGKLWVWLHCVKEDNYYRPRDRRSGAFLYVPDMFKSLVGKTLTLEFVDRTKDWYIGYDPESRYAVPEWLVSKAVK